MVRIRNELSTLGTDGNTQRVELCNSEEATYCSNRKCVTAIYAQSACFNSEQINSRHLTSEARVHCQDRLSGAFCQSGNGATVSATTSLQSFVKNTSGVFRTELGILCSISINVLKKSNKMQQYADIYLLQNYCTCFGRPSRPLSGVHKTLVADLLKRDQIRTSEEARSPDSTICTRGCNYSFMYS